MKQATRIRKPSRRTGKAAAHELEQLAAEPLDGFRSAPIPAGLSVRELGLDDQDRRDLTTRSIFLRLDTINEAESSVRCTLVTENVVPVFDWREFRMIDEVLLVSGFQAAPHLSFLDNHRSGNDDVFGSVVDLQVRCHSIDCKIVFADMSAHKDDPQGPTGRTCLDPSSPGTQPERQCRLQILEEVTSPRALPGRKLY